MKKIFSLLLLLTLCFTLVSCKSVDKNSEELFIKFEDGNESAIVSENFKVDETFGIDKIYDGTINEIAKQFILDWFMEEVDPSAYLINFEQAKFDDGKDYALYTITCNELNDVNLFLLVKNNDGKLEIVYEDACWSRRMSNFYKNGVILTYGSNGASSHMESLTLVDGEGNVKLIDELDAEGIYMTYLDPSELTEDDEYTTVNTYVLGNGNKYAVIYNYDEEFNVIEAREEIYNKLYDKLSDEYIICTFDDVEKFIKDYASELGVSLKKLDSKQINNRID